MPWKTQAMDLEGTSPRLERRYLIWLIVLIVPLYVLNGQWGTLGNTDVIAANLTSWQVVKEGTLDVSQYQVIQDNLDQLDRWFVELPDGQVITNRPPGLIALAIPTYAVLPSESFSLAPGTAVALLTTVLALVITWQVLVGLIGVRGATLATLLIAFGTPTWWISTAQLWPHGPDQLWSALAVLALSRSSYLGAGWAFAASVTTRPITAVSAAITGIREGLRQRSIGPVLKIGSVSALGLVVVVLFNRLVFGTWSITAPYLPGNTFTSGGFPGGAEQGFSVAAYLANLFDMFIGLPHGVLVTTPIIGVAMVGAWFARKSIPGWAMSAALAGLGYLIVHAALNRASAGLGIMYRYPLESIVLAAPALAIGGSKLWDSSKLGQRIVFVSAVISVFLQVLYVFYLVCFYDPSAPLCVEKWL